MSNYIKVDADDALYFVQDYLRNELKEIANHPMSEHLEDAECEYEAAQAISVLLGSWLDNRLNQEDQECLEKIEDRLAALGGTSSQSMPDHSTGAQAIVTASERYNADMSSISAMFKTISKAMIINGSHDKRWLGYGEELARLRQKFAKTDEGA